MSITKSDDDWYKIQDGWDEQEVYFNIVGLRRLRQEIEAILNAEEGIDRDRKGESHER